MLTPSQSQLKLIELLKTDEQCRGLIEKKEFGGSFILELKDGIFNKVFVNQYFNTEEEFVGSCLKEIKEEFSEKQINYKLVYNQCWNKEIPLSEHFIRLYCENTKKLKIDFIQEYILIINVFTKKQSELIKLDNTKYFYEQSDECYNSIYEALINL